MANLFPILLLAGGAAVVMSKKKKKKSPARSEEMDGGACESMGPAQHEGKISGWLVGDGKGGCRLECEPGYVLSEDGQSCIPER